MRNPNNRANILQSALELFSQKGYDAISVSDIVERAGVTKPTLYHFFGSKEGLFEELLTVQYGKLLAQMEEVCRYAPDAGESGLQPFLLRIVQAFFAFAKSNTAFYLLVLSLTFVPPSSRPAAMVEEYTRRQYLLLENGFREAAAAGAGPAGKERLASWEFLALVNARIGFWSHGHTGIDDAAAQAIVTQFLHGLLA